MILIIKNNMLEPSELLISMFPNNLIQMIYRYNQEKNIINSKRVKDLKPQINIELMNKYKSQLLDVYEKEKAKANDYQNKLGERFSEDEEIEIESIVSYMVNIQNGFAHLNDKEDFETIKINNNLYQEALQWIEKTRDYRFLQRIMIHYKVLTKY